jgi:YD repeat-containing protein
LSARNPENGLISYTYNPDGTVATRTDAKGQVVQYSCDSYQRLYKVHRSDGTEDNYIYDAYTGSQNAWGRVAAVTFQGQQVKAPYGDLLTGTSAFTYMYSYTQAGLVTAKRLHA